MKLTKALAIMVALVMVFICLDAPAVLSSDEHPWDQEGGGNNGIGGAGSDSTGTGPTDSYGSNPTFKDDLNWIGLFLVTVKYKIMSGFSVVEHKHMNKVADKNEKKKMTCVKTR